MTTSLTPIPCKLLPLELATPHTQAQWLEEPALLFADGKTHVDPRIGIPLYGPRSFGTARHKPVVHAAFIGTANAVDNARKFLDLCTQGVEGDESQAPFPGCTPETGFRCKLLMPDGLVEPISRQEEREILETKKQRDRFENFLLLLKRKLEVLTQRDHPLDYIVLVLTEELYRKCRVADYVEKGQGRVHRDLRRALKSLAMEFQKPTQILLEPTTGLVDTKRKLDHRAKVAWNLFTGMYFKVDGLHSAAIEPRLPLPPNNPDRKCPRHSTGEGTGPHDSAPHPHPESPPPSPGSRSGDEGGDRRRGAIYAAA